MPTFPRLACLFLAAVTLFSTAEATSLRAETGKVALSALSASNAKALAALSAKYDCSLGASNLVQTLKEVRTKNLAADASLTKECSDAQAAFESELKDKLEEADSITASASGKGEDVYSAGEGLARSAFHAVKARHNALISNSSSAKLDAEAERAAAEGEYNVRNGEKIKAEKLFEQQKIDASDQAKNEKKNAANIRDVSVRSLQETQNTTQRLENDRKDSSFAVCKSAYEARMLRVENDKTVMNEEIKPLLAKLKACDVSGGAFDPAAAAAAGPDYSTAPGAGNGGGGFLELKEKVTECKQAARNKLRRLQTSLVQISLRTPVEEVSGNMNDWEKRVADETEEAQNVRSLCEKEATDVHTQASADSQKIFDDGRDKAVQTYLDFAKKVDDDMTAAVAQLEAIKDATVGPASQAEAAVDAAKVKVLETAALYTAALRLQVSSESDAEAVLQTELAEAAVARDSIINSTKAAADEVRESARKDKEEKSAAKTEVCTHEHATFEAERDLVAQIKAKIEKLATIRDDTTGENAAAADAPDASPARL